MPVLSITVPIRILRVGVIGNHAARRNEAPQRAVIIAGVVVEQAEAVEPLAGEVVVGGVEAAAPISWLPYGLYRIWWAIAPLTLVVKAALPRWSLWKYFNVLS